MRIRISERLEYAAFRSLMFGLNSLPERIAYSLMSGIGQAFFMVSKRRRGYAMRLLRNAYPGRDDRELRRLGRRATGNLFKVGLDMVRGQRWFRSGRILERVDTELFDRHFPPAPFIGVTAHLGSWEVGAVATAQIRGEAHGIAKLHRNPLMRRFLIESRRRAGLHIHPRRGGLRDLKCALQNQRVALQVVDQNQRLRGVIVPFFGEPAATERAAATLAVRQGYPIVVGICVRVGGGFQFRCDTVQPLRPQQTGDVDRDVRELVTRINRVIEQFILRYPDQYNWIHNRYRTGDSSGSARVTAGVAGVEHN